MAAQGTDQPNNASPRDVPDDPFVGMVLAGRYVIQEQLARGAMGAVYLADQRPLGRRVAVKLLDPVDAAVGGAEAFRERFFREAGALAKLSHPNTVRVYDFGSWGGRMFLVLEYVHGHTLKRLLGAGPVPPARVLNIVLQICGALHEAHSLGMIHRDLKPANILLTRHAGTLDVVKVVDFGLAKGFDNPDDELTEQGRVMGTPSYMAPEQIRDEPCDPRTDVYAVGALLYRCLTGVHPFTRSNTTDILLAALHDAPPSFEESRPGLGLPPTLEAIVMRCLAKEPHDRFSSVRALYEALVTELRALRGESSIDATFDSGSFGRPMNTSEAPRLLHPTAPVERAPAAPVGTPSRPPATESQTVWVLALAAAIIFGLVGVGIATDALVRTAGGAPDVASASR